MIDSKLIDHTILKANTKKEDVLRICNEAYKYNFKSVCVNPCFVSLAYNLLYGSDILVCTVIGFPLGANTKEVKVFEAVNAVSSGASEIDMVINISEALDHNYEYIYEEIRSVVDACKVCVKVIIETCYFTDEEIEEISKCALRANATFIKTSTGFGSRGASVNDVLIMKKVANDKMGVKASGGIKTKDDVLKLIEAGATRIGTSSGVAIMDGDNNETNTNSSY